MDGTPHISRTATGYRLRATLDLPRPLDEVFAFFADAHNLERLTPSFLRFTVRTPAPIEMRCGTLIDYGLRLRGLPFRWRSEIAVWEPPLRFADRQVRGPYRHWFHEHRFSAIDPGTRCEDTVDYRVPGGALVHRLLVRRDVERIFRYRAEVLRALFDSA